MVNYKKCKQLYISQQPAIARETRSRSVLVLCLINYCLDLNVFIFKMFFVRNKAGVYMKAVFWLGIMVLTHVSRSRSKQSRISVLIPEILYLKIPKYSICILGCFVNFLVIFRYI